MKVAVFGARRYDRSMLAELNAAHGCRLTLREARPERRKGGPGGRGTSAAGWE